VDLRQKCGRKHREKERWEINVRQILMGELIENYSSEFSEAVLSLLPVTVIWRGRNSLESISVLLTALQNLPNY
jgi:hypothetical protein